MARCEDYPACGHTDGLPCDWTAPDYAADPARYHLGCDHETGHCEYEVEAACPACGERIDYCQGHGSIGDPLGASILASHDDDDHRRCHPDAECG